jgi:hypothetical protein
MLKRNISAHTLGTYMHVSQYLCTWINALGEMLKYSLGNEHCIDKYNGSLALILHQNLIKRLQQSVLPVLGNVYPFLFCFSTLFVKVLRLDENCLRVSAQVARMYVCECLRYKGNLVSAKIVHDGPFDGLFLIVSGLAIFPPFKNISVYVCNISVSVSASKIACN